MKDYEECTRCGRVLKKGDVKFIVYISIVSDFDGVISGEDSMKIEDILAEADSLSEEELDKEVYEEMGFILCKPCRDKFRNDLLSVYEITEGFNSKPHSSFN